MSRPACPTLSASEWTRIKALFSYYTGLVSNLSRMSKQKQEESERRLISTTHGKMASEIVDRADSMDIAASLSTVDSGQGKGEVHLPEDPRPATRTTACDDQSCCRCGTPIRGRRRNGYCSDRCRMRDRRERERDRIDEALRRLEQCVADLRRELAGDAQP